MEISVADNLDGLRLDRYLAEQLPEFSRSRIQAWIRDGRVLVDDVTARPSLKLYGGEVVELEPAPLEPLEAKPEDIPLDILHEDEDIAVVNKPAGMTVHAGAGEAARSGTLVNALLYRFGKLSSLGGELRPGIVHRLDRFTSGVIVVAKNDLAHRRLAEQFESREVHKTYHALVHGHIPDPAAEPPRRRGRVVRVDGISWVRIEAPIGRDRNRRHRMAVVSSGRSAITDYRPVRTQSAFSRVEVRIHTGRTHQIRVHLSWAGHPVVGDRLYGAPALASLDEESERFYLHAARLSLAHPSDGRPMRFEAPEPPEFVELARELAL